jgi:hypothetical protein
VIQIFFGLRKQNDGSNVGPGNSKDCVMEHRKGSGWASWMHRETKEIVLQVCQCEMNHELETMRNEVSA